ncbi:MAG TPA: exopolysaccharide biosynthesis protein [Candidatus Megaira endosymbiont of Hartmannula sinica]|nr:exopolysaccharide biosynthesis protein [Candidatus Megaera endosymbiont of Hartmannula sinica]
MKKIRSQIDNSKNNKNEVTLFSQVIKDLLAKIKSKSNGSSTKVSQIVDDFHEEGILISLIFFGCPIALPLPYPPGFTTIFGMPLVILSMQLLLNYNRVALPTKINDFTIKNSFLINIIEKIIPKVIKIESYVKPRIEFARNPLFEKFLAIIMFIASLFVILPLPFTNAIPSQGIVVMSIALLNKDGIFMFVGLVVAILGMFVASLFIGGGIALVHYTTSYFTT